MSFDNHRVSPQLPPKMPRKRLNPITTGRSQAFVKASFTLCNVSSVA